MAAITVAREKRPVMNQSYQIRGLSRTRSTLHLPKALEPIGSEFGVAHRVLDIFVRPDQCCKARVSTPSLGSLTRTTTSVKSLVRRAGSVWISIRNAPRSASKRDPVCTQQLSDIALRKQRRDSGSLLNAERGHSSASIHNCGPSSAGWVTQRSVTEPVIRHA